MRAESCSCPHCKSDSTLVDYWTLFLTIENWPTTLLSLSVITIAGNLLELSANSHVGFLLIALIPTLFVVSRKKSCLDCNIDFDTPIPEPVRSNRGNRYEQF